MALDKAIEHGKEHRKPWSGKDRSKNFDKTCRNHGSCDYCRGNRMYSALKAESKADQRMKEERTQIGE